MLGLGIGVLAKLLWDALNWKAPPLVLGPQEGTLHTFGATNIGGRLRFKTRLSYDPVVNCSTGVASPAQAAQLTGWNYSGFFNGVTITFGSSVQTVGAECGGGSNTPATQVPLFTVRNSAGTVTMAATAGSGGVTRVGVSSSNKTTSTQQDWELSVNNGAYQPVVTSQPQTVPDSVRPVVPLPSAPPEPFRFPAPDPGPTILPATVPDSSPVPAPAPVPGGLPAVAPAPAPAPAAVPILTRTITRATPGSQTQTLTATGVTASPAPAPIRQTPAEAVMIGGQLVGGPGSSPPQGPGGTAAELGRLEGKSEMALTKLDRLGPLLEGLEVLQALGEWLLSADPGVTYTLQPPCGTDADGDPLPPVEVVVPPTIGVETATLARLDALAMLIDEHKQMRQPICKGKPTGSPVTVTGVELDP